MPAAARSWLTTAFRPGIRISVAGVKSRVSLPLEVCVRDNGQGVPPEMLPSIFDAFVTTKTNGGGLGLALVAKVIGTHGGIVECESAPNRTVFRVLLPTATGPSPYPGDVQGSMNQGLRNILVADDDSAIRTVVSPGADAGWLQGEGGRDGRGAVALGAGRGGRSRRHRRHHAGRERL